MIQEPFASGNSFIHKTDPRLKVFFAAIFSCAAALLNQFPSMTASLILSVILVLYARLDFIMLVKRLAVIWGFLVLLWAVLPLTFEGDIIYCLGPLEFTWQGIILAAKISIKSNAILLAFIALVSTMNFSTLGYVLNYFKIPGKLVHLLLLTYRYIFVIEQEYRRLVRSAKIRAFKPKTNMHTYKTYAYLAGMLFVRASQRADRVYHAMKCRGFKGRFYCLQEFSITIKDKAWLLIMLACLSIIISLEYFPVNYR